MGPKGVAVDRNGHIIVVDNKACCVFIFQSNGKLVAKFGSRGTSERQFAGTLDGNTAAGSLSLLHAFGFCRGQAGTGLVSTFGGCPGRGSGGRRWWESPGLCTLPAVARSPNGLPGLCSQSCTLSTKLMGLLAGVMVTNWAPPLSGPAPSLFPALTSRSSWACAGSLPGGGGFHPKGPGACEAPRRGIRLPDKLPLKTSPSFLPHSCAEASLSQQGGSFGKKPGGCGLGLLKANPKIRGGNFYCSAPGLEPPFSLEAHHQQGSPPTPPVLLAPRKSHACVCGGGGGREQSPLPPCLPCPSVAQPAPPSQPLGGCWGHRKVAGFRGKEPKCSQARQQIMKGRIFNSQGGIPAATNDGEASLQK